MDSYLPSGVLEEFVSAYLDADFPEPSGGRSPETRLELAPHRNAKSMYEYRIEGHRIIAKVYDDVQDGVSAFEIWHALWSNGFGPGSIHRVPEPVAYLPGRQTLLIEPAAGTCLLPLVSRDPVACREGMGHAARWLADLHTSPVRVGQPDNSARILYRLARKLTRAVSRSPDLADSISSLISELGRRGDAFASGAPQQVVQTHGRYHCGHVFVGQDTVTVIDLDRAAPADLAKDVAEFLCRFRIEAWKDSVKRRFGEELGAVGTQVFVDEYHHASTRPLPGLLYYWSATLLGLLLDNTLKIHLDERIRSARQVQYEAEFAALPKLVADLG